VGFSPTAVAKVKHNMSKYNDYPEVEKGGGGGGGGFRRFAMLVALVCFIAFGFALWGMGAKDTPTAVQPDTMPTAVPNGVAVNVSQAAPAINLSIDQPAPPPVDDAALQMAFMESQRAHGRADDAYRAAERAFAHADVLHGRVADLESAAPPPDHTPQLVAIEHQQAKLQSQLDILTGGLFLTLALLIALAGFVGWYTIPRPYPTAATPQIDQLTVHGANPVLHRANPVLTPTSGDDETLGEPLVISQNRPRVGRRAGELAEWERRYIQETYNRLKNYTATANHVWGYHNRLTLQCVKEVVG
jgi:hypothetical protein